MPVGSFLKLFLNSPGLPRVRDPNAQVGGRRWRKKRCIKVKKSKKRAGDCGSSGGQCGCICSCSCSKPQAFCPATVTALPTKIDGVREEQKKETRQIEQPNRQPDDSLSTSWLLRLVSALFSCSGDLVRVSSALLCSALLGLDLAKSSLWQRTIHGTQPGMLVCSNWWVFCTGIDEDYVSSLLPMYKSYYLGLVFQLNTSSSFYRRRRRRKRR